jgi:rhomboid protease GluP
MFRRSAGAILCPSCGRLTNADAAECLICGRRNPGMWGFTGVFRSLVGKRSFTDVVTIACIALYIASLLADPLGALRPRGLFDIFSPTDQALLTLGATGALPARAGRWWTLLTAIYLHGSLLHILFNVIWIRQLGPAVEELYGRARLVIIFTVAGVVGFVLSNFMGVPFTVGASGSIFGLLGAMVAYGRRRGGSFGALVLRQYGQWALILFLMGIFMGGVVNNIAHAGGFIGGLAAGLIFSFAERRAETTIDRTIAGALIAITLIAFAAALWTAVA